MYKKTTEEMRHIIPVSVTRNSKSDLSGRKLSSFQISCVCACVCRRGPNRSNNIENNQEKDNIHQLYEEFLEAQ